MYYSTDFRPAEYKIAEQISTTFKVKRDQYTHIFSASDQSSLNNSHYTLLFE